MLPSSSRNLLGLTLAGCVTCLALGRSDAATLYAIPSFDPNDAGAAISSTVMYVPGVVSISVFPGLTGTSANELLTLQTLNANAGTALGGSRFQNSDADAAQTNGTLIADASANYFQFGIAGGGGLITLQSLTFDAKKATAGVSTRGYDVMVSVNGGAYSALGAANLVADRNAAPFDNVNLSLAGAQFQNISSLDFRIRSTGGGVEYTNFAINGNVPEPTATTLGLFGLGLLVLRRRRK